MKRIASSIILILFLLFSSCEFNQSIHTDFLTGATSRGNGISCEHVDIIINEKIETRNTFTFGENVVIYFYQMDGFEQFEGKIFSGLSLTILNSKNDTLVNYLDLLSENEEGLDYQDSSITASFNVISKSEENEELKLYIKIWDKKGEGTFDYTLPFYIKQNEFLEVETSGLEFDQVYLWNKTKKIVIVDNILNSEDETQIFFNGIRGFTEKEGMVYPKFQIEIIDNNENIVISSENLLSKFEQTGIVLADFENNPVFATFSFVDGQIYNPVKMKVMISDINSEKFIKLTTDLEINQN